jgi:cellulose synthase/poly-beta-1,6-N-acetylglucosamine synthase-like glycosyltransferase
MTRKESIRWGPVPDVPPVIDNFTYEDVRESHCVAQVSEKVCKSLIETSYVEGKRFLTICCPAYNEEVDEMEKTLSSLLESFDYMYNKTPSTSKYSSPAVQEEFQKVIPVIVPLFDGTKALSASMREWLNTNFPGCLNELDGKSGPGKVDVRTYCSKWYYYTGTNRIYSKAAGQTQNPKKNVQPAKTHKSEKIVHKNRFSPANDTEEKMAEDIESGGNGIELVLNALNNEALEERKSRKSVAEDVEGGDNASTVVSQQSLVTDVLISDRRVATHNAGADDDIIYFYMCPVIKKSNHRKHNSHQWFFDSICEGLDDKCTYAFLTDCGTSYDRQCLSSMLKELYLMDDLIGVTARQRVELPNRYFRPCEWSPFWLLQGDHSVNKNACWKCWATFALTACPLQGFEFEASTVLSLAVFNLVEALPVMPGPCQLMHWQKMKKYHVVDEYFNLLFEGENEKKLPQLPPGLKQMQLSRTGSEFRALTETSSNQRVRSLTASPPSATALTFTEFLRVNMRLAEDRILSFVSVFSTGYGTKWVAGSTFYYQPEVQWNTLLTQRRRWINGTFAGFLFYFMSPRARARVNGGLFDTHKAGRSKKFIDSFFGLQIFQMFFVLITPAVFGVAGYLGMDICSELFPYLFGLFRTEIYGPIRGVEVWTGLFLAILAGWVYLSFNAPKGKIPEWLCQTLIVYGFLYTIPIYLSVWYYIIFKDFGGLVGAIVMSSIALPFIITAAESIVSAVLYLTFLPWFIFASMFFLVFIPHYSLARLWDTTWGNRPTGSDSAISNNMESFMKSRNVYFSIFLVALNIVLTYALAKLLAFGEKAVIVFLLVSFLPMFLQIIFSFLYMFILLPFRKMFLMGSKTGPSNQASDLGIDMETSVKDIDATNFFMESAFPLEGNGQQFINPQDKIEHVSSSSPPTVSSWLDFSPPGSPKSSELATLLPRQQTGNNDPARIRLEVAGRFCKV